MMTLYAARGTGSIAPQAMLKFADADHEVVWIDYGAGEHKSADFLAINPRGQIPALKLADGTVMTESAAIVLHIADSCPAAGLIAAPGTSERAEIYRWVVFLATNNYEDFLRLAYPGNYTTNPAGESAVSESGKSSLDRSWGIINDALAGRTTLVSDSVSVADIYMAMLLSWRVDWGALESKYPNLRPAYDNTLSNPAIREVFAMNEGY